MNEDGLCLLRNHQQVVEYQKVRFVIPWKKDPRTNRPLLKYVEQWRKGSTYFMLHMEVAHRHKPCVLNTLVVHKNGWKKIVNIHSELEDIRVLNLYYSNPRKLSLILICIQPPPEIPMRLPLMFFLMITCYIPALVRLLSELEGYKPI